MKLNLELKFNTEGYYWFDNEDKILELDSPLYHRMDTKISYAKNFDLDNEQIRFILSVEGNSNECRSVAKELLGNLVCNIHTTCYFVVKQLADFLCKTIMELNTVVSSYRYQDAIGNGTFVFLNWEEG